MTGVILAACAAVLVAGSGSLWQRQRSRRRLGGHSSALLDLGRVAGGGGERSSTPPGHTSAGPGHTGEASPEEPTRGWTAPPPAPPLLPDHSFPQAPAPAPAPASGYTDPRPQPASHGRRHRRSGLGFLLSGLAGLGLAALVIAAITFFSGSGSNGSRRAATAAPTPSTTTAPPSTAAPTTTVPSSTTAAPGVPALSSISPSSGAPGQTVTLTGSNLFSPSGLITVTFAGVQAGVSCPSSTTCVVTVPSGLNPSASIPVAINTGTGTSPSVNFTYP